MTRIDLTDFEFNLAIVSMSNMYKKVKRMILNVNKGKLVINQLLYK